MFEDSAIREIAPAPAQTKVLSRRQVVKAGAWAAPAVAVAIATPAAMASPTITKLTGPTITSSTGSNRTLNYTLSVSGSTLAPTASLTWTRVHNGTTTTGVSTGVVTGSNGSYTVVFTFTLSGNNGTRTAIADFSVGGTVLLSDGPFNL
jgi:hypothetical protein